MSPGSHARGELLPETPSPRPRQRWSLWVLGTPAVFSICGILFVASATSSGGTDLRPGRYTDLASLVQNEADEYAGLEDRVKDLDGDIDALTSAVADRSVKRVQAKIERMKDPAGLTERSGAGVRVTLSDAPEEVINATTRPIELLVVHQQDIQAVVNAMWVGGATAVTVNGQRIISTTGIKCEGNAVQLQGIPYSQPYVIEGVGDPTLLTSAIERNDYLSYYRAQAAEPDISVGWLLEPQEEVVAPAYSGLTDLTYAEVIR